MANTRLVYLPTWRWKGFDMSKRFEDARARLAEAKNDTSSLLSLLPEFDFEVEWDFYDSGDGATLFMFNDIDYSRYDNYCRRIADVGFDQNFSNEINKNYFRTYTKDNVTIDIWYINYAREMRLTIQKDIPVIPAQMPCESYTKVEPALVTLGGYGFHPGMAFVIRLENSNFIIIDGGHGDNMWKYVYDTMKALSHGEAIVIESWIFTHSHSDHIAAFTQFANVADLLADKVILKSVIANFAGKEQASAPTQQLHPTDEIIRNIVKENFPTIPFYKAHPGNEFNFAGLKAEILGTHESFTTTREDWPFLYNACNLLIKITVAGQIIMIEGDNDTCNNVILGKTYGNYLKCDILQADHHGNFGGVCEVNKLFAPEVVIFFHCDRHTEEFHAKEYNQTLFNNPNYKEHIIADTKRFIMMLPYKVNSAIEEQLEK